MDMSDRIEIAAPREVVFAAILDPEVLKACVPGCTEMTGDAASGYEATVVQKVGPVKATFRGAVSVGDLNAPESLTIAGEGKGGAAGFAKGGASVTLSEADGVTTLDYTVEAKVGGKLAQLGGRIIDGFARKMAAEFFDRLKAAVEGPPEVAEAEAEAEETAKPGWFARMRGKGKGD